MARRILSGAFFVLLFTAAASGETISELKPLALKGDVTAQTKLARAYQYGRGVPQDLGQAAKWFRLAAEQGDLDAERYLGFAYRTGTGVPKSYIEFARWYLAAEFQKLSKK